MTHLVPVGHRPLRSALMTSAVLLSLSGAVVARADDRGRDARDRYYYHGDGGDRYHDRERDRRHHDDRHHGRGHQDPRGRGDRRGYDDRDYYGDHYYYNRGYRYDGYGDRRWDDRRLVAPRHLYYRDYPAYDRYYRGSVYYAPHRHSHRIYLFPVIVGGYVEYRPYSYCGDAYFDSAYGYDGPRGHFGLHFDF